MYKSVETVRRDGGFPDIFGLFVCLFVGQLLTFL